MGSPFRVLLGWMDLRGSYIPAQRAHCWRAVLGSDVSITEVPIPEVSFPEVSLSKVSILKYTSATITNLS